MSHSDVPSGLRVVNASDESLPLPGISRADTLPEIEAEHAKALSQLKVSDGDFHTKAFVNGEFFSAPLKP